MIRPAALLVFSMIRPLAMNFQYDLIIYRLQLLVENLTIVNMVFRACELLTVNNRLITLLKIRC